MERREFVSLLGGAALAWPSATRAQQTPIRIGFLPVGLESNGYDQSLVEAFRRGLRQVGLIENQDVALDIAWISGDPDEAVARVVKRGAKVLVTGGTVAALAAKRGAPAIPIVFINVGDPIGVGLVASLSRPGGNATGLSVASVEASGKLVQFAEEAGGGQAPIGYLWHTDWADGRYRLEATEKLAQTLGASLRAQGIAGTGEINAAVAKMRDDGARAIIVQPSPFTYQERGRVIDAATICGLATIFTFQPAAREGALIAYGADYVHLYLRAPFYLDRILRGAKPGDLPVEEPAKFELIINLKVAKQLKLDVPLSLLIRADELIE